MNRIDITQLKKVEEVFGDFDMDQSLGSNTVYLRFGYWRQINLSKLKEIIGNNVEENDIYDDDCGWLYSYHLK